MAKDRKKLQHIHSSIPDKQPTAASLEVAEIAVNNAKEQEFLSIKNTDNKVVRFSSDGQIIEWIERKEVMPYKGYVRGEGGPTATSGDSPSADTKGSYGISNEDLLANKSQLVFKLNQVAASATTKHEKVNGAKDLYGVEVNPTDDYGVNDGAGFFIDMSRYAMIDANPSFSALTATCQTRLSGNTYISDGASANTYGTDSGHTLYILTTDVSAHNKTWKEEISAKTEDISGRTTTIGNNGERLHVIGTTTEVHDGNVTITNKSNVVENTSGTTTETKKGVVTETNLSAKTENTSGTSTTNIVENNIANVSGETHITTTGNTAIHTESKLGLTAKDDILESSEADIVITADQNVCETAGVQASFYGVAQTNLGLDCANSTPSVVTNLYGDTINTDADTANTTIGTAITQINSANTTVGTAVTSANTATTIIKVANTSATTATLSGNTLDIKEATRISAVTPTMTVSGTNLNITETNTTINSCGKIEFTTDNFTVNSCSNTSTSTFNFCNGYTLNSDKVTIEECNGNGTILIKEKGINLSGGTLSSTTTADTIVKVGGNLSAFTTSNTCVIANDSLNLGGNTNTRIGADCAGKPFSDNVYISATTLTEVKAPTITLSGETTNITGSSNVNIKGDDICISGGTEASMGAKTVNVGTDCGGSMIATTINISGTTINEGGTTNNNNFTTINNTATTINNNTTNYNITGTTNIEGDTNIDGNLDVTENVHITGDTYIDGTLHLTQGIENKLYFQTGTTDVSQSPYDGHEDRTITIPSCVSHLDRKTLSWSLGKPSAGNYDPGDAACSGDEPFKIPSTLKHLTEWNNGCLEVDGCLKATAVYSTSDERAKENIERANYGKACFAHDVVIKQFNLKSDESKRTTYGVIAQDVISHGLEELVYTNDEGLYAVDYTSLMILKIRYLENELEALRHKISQLENKEQ